MLCERGIRTFESYTRNTLDISAIPVVQKLSHLPVIVDPSHGTGRRDKVAPMARAAVAAGADGLLIEVHCDPDQRAVRRRAVALSHAVRAAHGRAADHRAGHRPQHLRGAGRPARLEPLAAMNPPCATVGVAGLGVIGASIALRVRATWPDVRVIGLDRRRVIQEALRAGVIHDYRTALADFADCDLVILATPVPAILELLDEAAAGVGPRAVITDVGSTKRVITAAATRLGLTRFVGGHPMAGSEHAGLGHASATLFDGRPWLIVAADSDRGDSVSLVERFARGLGAEPRRIDAAAHDRIMAYVSHVPQLVASALMTTAGQRCGQAALAACGPAFAEMTRVAASPFESWRGTLATNADFVIEALEAFVGRLPSAQALGEGGEMAALFAEAQRWRAALAETLRGQA